MIAMTARASEPELLGVSKTHVLSANSLWWETNAAQQVLEMRVGAEVTEYRLHLEMNQVRMTLLICFFQPLERPVVVS
jgi:hypothetical protein